MEKFQHLPRPVYQEPPTYNFSGFGTRKEEDLYDKLTGSLLRLLSMRLALSFQMGGETATMARRMHKEDKKLKEAIGKHYKKMDTMERNKYSSFNFSDCVTDLVHALGFRKSKEREDELSRVSSSQRRGQVDSESEDSSSVFSVTRHTESKYASLAIEEENRSLADRIINAKEKSKGPTTTTSRREAISQTPKSEHLSAVQRKSEKAPRSHNRLDDLKEIDVITPQPVFAKIEPTSAYDNQHVKIVANDLSNRFSNLIHSMTAEAKPADQSDINTVLGITYHADMGANTIDLVGVPEFRSFVPDLQNRDTSPKVLSNGVDFHQNYKPPPPAPIVYQTSGTQYAPPSAQTTPRRDAKKKYFAQTQPAAINKIQDSMTVVIDDGDSVRSRFADASAQYSNHQQSNKFSPSRDVSIQADIHATKKIAIQRSPGKANRFVISGTDFNSSRQESRMRQKRDSKQDAKFDRHILPALTNRSPSDQATFHSRNFSLQSPATSQAPFADNSSRKTALLTMHGGREDPAAGLTTNSSRNNTTVGFGRGGDSRGGGGIHTYDGKSDQKVTNKIPPISEISFASRQRMRSPQEAAETVSFKAKSTSSRPNQFITQTLMSQATSVKDSSTIRNSTYHKTKESKRKETAAEEFLYQSNQMNFEDSIKGNGRFNSLAQGVATTSPIRRKDNNYNRGNSGEINDKGFKGSIEVVPVKGIGSPVGDKGGNVIQPAPIYVDVHSRQKKRTMVKNVYAAATKKDPLVQLQVPIMDNGPQKPSQTDQRLPQSMLDQHSSIQKGSSISSKQALSNKDGALITLDLPTQKTPTLKATAKVRAKEEEGRRETAN